MNLTEIIENALIDTHEESNLEIVAAHITKKLESHLKLIVEMRYAQRSYFRRRNEDNLSKAKKLEIMVDELLQPIDTKRNLVIQPDLLIY